MRRSNAFYEEISFIVAKTDQGWPVTGQVAQNVPTIVFQKLQFLKKNWCNFSLRGVIKGSDVKI